MVVHQDRPDTTADTTAIGDIGLIVLYFKNATKRISTHDLGETISHESVHAACDAEHVRSDAWRRAQNGREEYADEDGD